MCHLFLIIKEVSENDGPQKPIKTLFIDGLCVEEKARGQKLGEKLYQFALDYATLDFYEHLGVKPRYTEMKTILK